MGKTEIRKQFDKVYKLIKNYHRENDILCDMMSEYYGENHYSDFDKDEIIECLNYGANGLTFQEFDKIMREINNESL